MLLGYLPVGLKIMFVVSVCWCCGVQECEYMANTLHVVVYSVLECETLVGSGCNLEP